jgi:hypothetical protein
MSVDKLIELFKKALLQCVNTQLFTPRNDQVEVVIDKEEQERC